MANPKFCYPNWTLPTSFYTPTITGPGWIDLAKLQGPVLSEMARYPGVNPANTKLLIDLGTTRNVNTLAIPFHNAKLGDKARIRLATDLALTDIVLDTGWKEFFGEIYPYGSLEWGRVEWLDGRMTPEQAAGKMPPWLHVQKADVLGRYLDVQADFSGNSDGFVDLGQIVAASGITPFYNFSYGVQPPFPRDPSTKRRAKGGPQFVDRQRPYLCTSMQLNHLNVNETYGAFYEMVRDYGVSKPFFFIYDADAPAAILQKQCFMAIAENIGRPAHRVPKEYSLDIEISQAF